MARDRAKDVRSTLLVGFPRELESTVWPDNSTNRFYERIAGTAPNRKPRARLPTRSNNLLESSSATCFYPKSRVFFKIRLSMNKLSGRRGKRIDAIRISLSLSLYRSNLMYNINPNSNSKYLIRLHVIYHLLNSSSQQPFPISSF